MYTKNHIHEHTKLPTNLNGTAERSQIYLHIHTMEHYVVLSKKYASDNYAFIHCERCHQRLTQISYSGTPEHVYDFIFQRLS